MALVFGYKYYTMARKVQELKFKYPWKQWFSEILFLNHCKCESGKCCSVCKKSDKSHGKNKKKHQSFLSGHQSQVSGDAVPTELPSFIITEPVEGSETGVEDPDTFTVLEHNPDNDKAFDPTDIPKIVVEEEEEVDVMRVLFSKADEDEPSNTSVSIVDET